MASMQKPSKCASAPEAFNYDGVEPELAKFLRNRARLIKSQVRQQTRSIIETGAILQDVKARLEHGSFTVWVQAELGCSLRTAENYMRAAEFANGKNEIVSRLPPATVYALAAPSTPDEVKSKVMGALETGKDIDVRTIESQIRRAREGKGSRKDLEPKPVGGDAMAQVRATMGEVAAILGGALSGEAYRRVGELLTGPAIVNHPTHFVRVLKEIFVTSKSNRSRSGVGGVQ